MTSTPGVGGARRRVPAAVARRWPWLADAATVARLRGARQVLLLDHPHEPRSRWGWGEAAHPGLAAVIDPSLPGAVERLWRHAPPEHVAAEVARSAASPPWGSGWMSPLDAGTLWALLTERVPRRYVEVGSGVSTRFARSAIDSGGLGTELVSIDPAPRVEVDALCDRVVRSPAQDADPGVWGELDAGDVLFIDGSHRAAAGSDVVVLLCEVVPALPPGVVVHVHDVFLPDDYPPSWHGRWYSEQYLLAAALLAGPGRYEVLAANHRLATTRSGEVARWRSGLGLGDLPLPALDTSFWFTT